MVARPNGPRLDPALLPLKALERLIQCHPDSALADALHVDSTYRPRAKLYIPATYPNSDGLEGVRQLTRTNLFQSNRSQAVRLPKDVAFPEGVREVAILRDGDRRVIVPADRQWDDFFAASGIDIDENKQPEAQVRESF
ncbi:type II toxin-antitoxin system VapB family antitoxin [Sphingomonas sp. Leaf22]|uniref:type II toxin-antitoxin system VapB family antitoxin n=1 Tax=Sphingomonas sp. Leaf22 TaxID=1735687 RepID=UPI0009EAFB4B|nr:type II toxin-antitoxin system VapB family antitoxin [Sphingomonas sp. Leaf22]